MTNCSFDTDTLNDEKLISRGKKSGNVSDFSVGRFGRGELKSDPNKVWLNSSYRVMLIKEGIEKAGSINKLGRELGYRSRVHPGWSIRQILLGYQPFPTERLKRLAEYLGTPFSDVIQHQTHPRSVTLESTRNALYKYGLGCYYPR
jgi:hypothetical protein